MFRVILLQLTVLQLRRLFICNFSHMTLLMSRMTWLKLFFFFERKFQPMASALDDNSLSSDQDTNHFLV